MNTELEKADTAPLVGKLVRDRVSGVVFTPDTAIWSPPFQQWCYTCEAMDPRVFISAKDLVELS